MRFLLIAILTISVIGLLTLSAQGIKPPEKLVFKSLAAPVTFDHAAHVKRVDSKCQTCHPKPFAMSAKAPLNFKGAMHKTAEANKTSCAVCHVAGGKAFATAGNCAKCHVPPKAAS
jgi:c(7)-type cytochrome triheme protein